jgi:hypothetical protein
MGKTQYAYSPALGRRVAVKSATPPRQLRKRERKLFKVEVV